MIYLLKYWKQIAAVLIIAAVVWKIDDFGYGRADKEWQSKWDKYQLEIALANSAHAARVSELEYQLQTEINKVNKDAKTQLDRLQTDLVAANTASISLREQARKYAASAKRCADDTTTTDLRGSAQEAAGVLADMLEKSDYRAGVYAEYADKLEIARDACESGYKAAIETFTQDQ